MTPRRTRISVVALSRVCPTLRFPLAGAAAASLLCASLVLAGRSETRPVVPIISGSSFPPPPLPRWNSRTPLPPPPAWATPALLARFFALSAPFGQAGLPDARTFQSWMVASGVIDPIQQAQLLALLRWYGQTTNSVAGQRATAR